MISATQFPEAEGKVLQNVICIPGQRTMTLWRLMLSLYEQESHKITHSYMKLCLS